MELATMSEIFEMNNRPRGSLNDFLQQGHDFAKMYL